MLALSATGQDARSTVFGILPNTLGTACDSALESSPSINQPGNMPGPHGTRRQCAQPRRAVTWRAATAHSHVARASCPPPFFRRVSPQTRPLSLPRSGVLGHAPGGNSGGHGRPGRVSLRGHASHRATPPRRRKCRTFNIHSCPRPCQFALRQFSPSSLALAPRSKSSPSDPLPRQQRSRLLEIPVGLIEAKRGGNGGRGDGR